MRYFDNDNFIAGIAHFYAKIHSKAYTESLTVGGGADEILDQIRF